MKQPWVGIGYFAQQFYSIDKHISLKVFQSPGYREDLKKDVG